MRRWTLITALTLLTATAGSAKNNEPVAAPSAAPKLIIAISVDQFSALLFEEYRGSFSAGLKRLSAGGAAFAAAGRAACGQPIRHW